MPAGCALSPTYRRNALVLNMKDNMIMHSTLMCYHLWIEHAAIITKYHCDKALSRVYDTLSALTYWAFPRQEKLKPALSTAPAHWYPFANTHIAYRHWYTVHHKQTPTYNPRRKVAPLHWNTSYVMYLSKVQSATNVCGTCNQGAKKNLISENPGMS